MKRKPPESRPGVPAELQDAARGIRLQKALAEAGVASRRESETLITEGRVRVNGQTVRELPAWVDPQHDRIEVDGHPIVRPRKSKWRTAGKTYVMLHKPRSVISTTHDPEGRRNVLDLVDVPQNVRLFPVGRLDADSTGLILLTDDGELANRLTHPRYGVAKQYRVSIRGRLDETDLQKLRNGLFLAHKGTAGRDASVKKASVESVAMTGYQQDRARGDRTNVVITLREGQNREIRRLIARLGYKVRRLQRIGIGPIKLKGLAPGTWRMLSGKEVAMLYKAAGLGKN